MDYKGFSANMEATAAVKRAIEDFAEEQTDGTHFCPQCGKKRHCLLLVGDSAFSNIG